VSGVEQRKPRKAIREANLRRSPRDKGTDAEVVLQCYDSGIWVVNGELCDTDMETVEAVVDVLRAMQKRRDALRNEQYRSPAA
jgi:hypothetical protein